MTKQSATDVYYTFFFFLKTSFISIIKLSSFYNVACFFSSSFFCLYTVYTLTNTLGYSVRLIFVALDTVFLRSFTFTGINLGVKLFISLYLHSPKLSLYLKKFNFM